jgi:hypothetical protein
MTDISIVPVFMTSPFFIVNGMRSLFVTSARRLAVILTYDLLWREAVSPEGGFRFYGSRCEPVRFVPLVLQFGNAILERFRLRCQAIRQSCGPFPEKGGRTREDDGQAGEDDGNPVFHGCSPLVCE